MPPARSWTVVEQAVWRQLCAGAWAELSDGDTSLDPDRARAWSDRQVLSSGFVEQLLDAPYVNAIGRYGIRLEHAWFRDDLILDEAAIAVPLRCHQCRLAGVRAGDATINGVLDLGGSTITGDVYLGRADVDGHIAVNDGAEVVGTFNADELSVTGGLLLNDSSRFNEVNLRVDQASVASSS